MFSEFYYSEMINDRWFVVKTTNTDNVNIRQANIVSIINLKRSSMYMDVQLNQSFDKKIQWFIKSFLIS